MVRAKGFLTFAESPGYLVTLQQCGARVDARATEAAAGDGARAEGGRAPAAAAGSKEAARRPQGQPPQVGCTLVMIGQALDRSALLDGLRACEAPGADDDGGVLADECGPCAEISTDDGREDPSPPPPPPLPPLPQQEVVEAMETQAAQAAQAARAAEATELSRLGEAFAQCVRSDQRFEVEGVDAGGALVRFRLLGWFGVAGDVLTRELLDAAGQSATGPSWLAPCRRQRSAESAPTGNGGGGGGGG